MKKVLLTAATLIALLSTGAFAQRYGYPPAPPTTNYPQRQPGYNQPGYNQSYGQNRYNYDYDDYRFDRHLDWWDRELNLTRKQEREIRRVRARYTQQTQQIDFRDPRQREFLHQARQREFFDMMAILGPQQRDRVIARMRPYELSSGNRSASRGRGYGNGRGTYDPYGH